VALNWTTLENALHAWIVAATGLAADRVIWSHQGVPERPAPYVTLKILDLSSVGHDGLVQSYDGGAPAGQEITFTLEGRRHLTVSVQAFSDAATGATSAHAILSKARTALSLPGVHAALLAGGLAAFNEGGITDLSAIRETRWQSRAAMQVRFHCVDSAAEKTTWIETVEVTQDEGGA
jgi:hypothetical protein